jgi:predicted permease
MKFISLLASAFIPIAFVILLGVLAGRKNLLKPSASVILSALVLDFCLPAELFNAMATTSLASLPGWRFMAGIAAGLLTVFLIVLCLATLVYKRPVSEAGLHALNASFPNIAFIGIPIVLAVVGKSGLPDAVVAIVISSLLLPPIALTLLAAGAPGETAHGPMLVAHSLWGALRQSVVWAPLLGVIFALVHLQLPSVAQSSLTLIGEATTGVALFALGLLLSGQRLHIGLAALSITFVKNIAQPALMWGIALALGLSGEPMRVMIICGALPIAPMTAMFALKFNTAITVTEESILCSTVLSLVSAGIIIALIS